MLPKVNRLAKSKEIKDLAQKGKTFFLPQFIFKYYKKGQEPSQFAFVVSTKVDKRAVVRNKLTRRLKEAIKELLPQLENGYFVLIIAKKTALDLDFSQIKKQLTFALSKIKIYT